MRIKDVTDCKVLIDQVNAIIQKLNDTQTTASKRKKLERDLISIRSEFQELKDMLNNIIIVINKTLVKDL